MIPAMSVLVNFGPSIDGFFVTQGSKTVWRSNPIESGLHYGPPNCSRDSRSSLTADWTATAPAGYIRRHTTSGSGLRPSQVAASVSVPSGQRHHLDRTTV